MGLSGKCNNFFITLALSVSTSNCYKRILNKLSYLKSIELDGIYAAKLNIFGRNRRYNSLGLLFHLIFKEKCGNKLQMVKKTAKMDSFLNTFSLVYDTMDNCFLLITAFILITLSCNIFHSL